MNKKIIIIIIVVLIFSTTLITAIGAKQNQTNQQLATANGLDYSYKIVGEEKAYEELTALITQQNFELEPKNTQMADFVKANKYTVDQTKIEGKTPYQINQYYESVISENYQSTAEKLISDLDTLYTKNKDFKYNETEKKEFDAAKKEFDTLKVVDATTIEEQMQHITDLQANKTKIDKVIADYNARIKAEKAKADSKKAAEEEAKSTGGEVVYNESEGTYDVSYAEGGTPPANSSSNTEGSSSSSESNGSGNTPVCLVEFNWSNNLGMGGTPVDPIECLGDDPKTETQLITNEDDICTWVQEVRIYVGVDKSSDPVDCVAVPGTPGNSYYIDTYYLPSYDFVNKNQDCFPAVLQSQEGKEEYEDGSPTGHVLTFEVDLRDGQIYVDVRALGEQIPPPGYEEN